MSENRVQIVLEGDAKSAQAAIDGTGKRLVDLSTSGDKASKSLKDADASTTRLGKSTGDLGSASQATGQALKQTDSASKSLSSTKQQLDANTRKAAESFRMEDAAAGMLARTIQAVAAAYALYETVNKAKEAALLATQYEAMGVAMHVVGNNAGYTAREMDTYSDAIMKQGISLVGARDAATKMASAQLDMSRAADLARVAQDAARVGHVNSTEAFLTLVHGIQSGQIEVLRNIGLMVNFEQAYDRAAKASGRTAAQLTEQEKIQVRMNETFRAGATMAGVYAGTLGMAEQEIKSSERNINDLKLAVGNAFLPATTEIVRQFTKELEEMSRWANNNQESIAALGTTASLAFKFILDLGREIGTMLKTALDGWNALPDVVKEAGLVVALFGGKTGKLMVAEIALIAGYAEDVAKVGRAMALVRSGQASYADIPMIDKDAFEAWLKAQETISGIESRLAAVRREIQSGAGVSIYSDENAKRLVQLRQVEADLQYKLDAARLKAAAPSEDDQADAARAADGRARRAQEQADAQAKLEEETRKKVLEAHSQVVTARNALAQVKADMSGDPMLMEMTKIEAAYEKYKAEMAAKMADKTLPAAGKAELASAMAYEEQKYRLQRDFLQRSISLEREKLDSEREVQLASLEGVDTYYADLEAIRKKYAYARLKPDSPDAQWAGVMESAELAKRTRDQRKGNSERDLGLESELNKGLSELYATQSGRSIGGGLNEQAHAVEIERQQRILALTEKQRQAELAINEARMRGSDLGPQDQEELNARQKELDLINALLDVTNSLAAVKQQEIAASRTWQSGMQKGFQDYSDAASNYASQAENAVKNAFTGMENSLASFVVKGKGDWSSLVDTILMDLVKIQMRTSITGPLSTLLGGILPSFQGNVLGGDGISALSNGIYSQPTFFGYDSHFTAFAKGGVLGEAGPEAVMPLTRDSSGNLGVRAQGGGMVLNATINVSVPASSGNAHQDQTYANTIGESVQGALDTWWQDKYRQAHRPGAIGNGGVSL